MKASCRRCGEHEAFALYTLTTTTPAMFNDASHLNVGDVTQINAHTTGKGGNVYRAYSQGIVIYAK